MAEQIEELLTVPEFSKRANISEATVYRWVTARIIPCLKIRRIVRIPWQRALGALEKRMDLEITAAQEPVGEGEKVSA
jgi:excisionase family DNA binding protein